MSPVHVILICLPQLIRSGDRLVLLQPSMAQWDSPSLWHEGTRFSGAASAGL